MAPVSQPAGVEFVQEDDGRVTARHVETGVASFGDDEVEALRQLADAGLIEYRSGYHDYRWLGSTPDADPVDDSDVYDPTDEF